MKKPSNTLYARLLLLLFFFIILIAPFTPLLDFPLILNDFEIPTVTADFETWSENFNDGDADNRWDQMWSHGHFDYDPAKTGGRSGLCMYVLNGQPDPGGDHGKTGATINITLDSASHNEFDLTWYMWINELEQELHGTHSQKFFAVETWRDGERRDSIYFYFNTTYNGGEEGTIRVASTYQFGVTYPLEPLPQLEWTKFNLVYTRNETGTEDLDGANWKLYVNDVLFTEADTSYTTNFSSLFIGVGQTLGDMKMYNLRFDDFYAEFWYNPYLNTQPEQPTSLETEGRTNPIMLTVDEALNFTAINHDDDGAGYENATSWEIKIGTSWWGEDVWNSTKQSFTTPVPDGVRSENMTYSGLSLDNGTIYYWRVRFYDLYDVASPWSEEYAIFYIMTVPYGDYPKNVDIIGMNLEGNASSLRPYCNVGTYYNFTGIYWYVNDTAMFRMVTPFQNLELSFDWDSNVISIINGSQSLTLGTFTNLTLGDAIFVSYNFTFTPLVINALAVDCWMFCNDTLGRYDGWEEIRSNYFDIFGGAQFGYPYLENVVITNMEGCGNWVFAQERNYVFQAEYGHTAGASYLDQVGLRFSDGINTITVYYNNTLRDAGNLTQWSLVVNPIFDEDYLPVNLRETLSEASILGSVLTVNFSIFFTGEIFDELDVNISMYVTDIYDNTVDWNVSAIEYFNIYNRGGQTTLLTENSAGRIVGGDGLELYAYNNSYASSNITYRKLQSTHLYVRIQGNKVQFDEFEGDPRNFTFGMYYCPKGEEFIKGWKVVLTPTDKGTFMAEQILGKDAYYITWNVTWYDRNPVTSDWREIKMDYVVSFPVWNGTTNLYTAFWIDLWFNNLNSSSILGGRVNAEYFGVREEPGFFSLAWEAYLGNATQSMFFRDLHDTDGDIISARRITLMKYFVEIEQGVNPNRNYVTILRDYDILDFTRAQGDMTGVSTPIVVSTKMPELGSFGFLMALGNVFRAMGNAIINALVWAGLRVWPLLVGFLDMMFSFAGWENGFSVIVGWISSFVTFMISSMTYLGTMLLTIFTLMGTWVLFGITQFTLIGAGLMDIWSNINYIYTEANAGWYDLTELVAPLLPLLPLGFFLWMCNSRDMEHLMEKMKLVWGLVNTVVMFFVQIAQSVFNYITGLIETVPEVQ